MNDRETVVIKDGGSGAGITAVVAIVVLAIVLILGWYRLIGPGSGTSSNTYNAPDLDVNLPSAPAPEAS